MKIKKELDDLGIVVNNWVSTTVESDLDSEDLEDSEWECPMCLLTLENCETWEEFEFHVDSHFSN